MLRIVDWELAARGDPAWDVGSALAEFVSGWLMSVPLPTGADPAECLPLATLPLDSLKQAARRFWSAYAKGRGLAHSERAAVFRTTLLYAAARLIQLAYEHLQSVSKLTMHAVSHLQLSENLFGRPIDGAAQLLGIPA
jgi:aminoglycoside phosphotransferase (APT) family kinase protein